MGWASQADVLGFEAEALVEGAGWMVCGAGFEGDAVDTSVGGEGGDCLDQAAADAGARVVLGDDQLADVQVEATRPVALLLGRDEARDLGVHLRDEYEPAPLGCVGKARLDPTDDGLSHRCRVTPRGNAFSQARHQGEHSRTIGLLERPYLDPHGWQCLAFV